MAMKWEPWHDAHEVRPGAWTLTDGLAGRWAAIELRRVNGGAEVRYRVVVAGELAGWATSLRAACEGARRYAIARQDRRREEGVWRFSHGSDAERERARALAPAVRSLEGGTDPTATIGPRGDSRPPNAR